MTEDELDTRGGVTMEQAQGISNMLRSIRGKVPQRVIANRAGVSQTYVDKVERQGYMSGRAIDFFKLVCAYGIEPNDIARFLGLLTDAKDQDSLRVKVLIQRIRSLDEDELPVIERLLDGFPKRKK